MSQTATLRCPRCQASIEHPDAERSAPVCCPHCRESLGPNPESNHSEPPIGSFRHFDLLEIIGEGSFGVVWKALDTHLDRTVALKMARRSGQGTNTRDIDLIAREARAAAQLQHAGIVPVYETGVIEERAYIVTGLVDGESLRSYLGGQSLPSRQAATICVRIAEALTHAHEAGVIHRDLKPSNILIDRHGEPHITDFGLAKRECGDVTVTLHGQTMGTPAYMSPEQAMGESRYVDRRTDIYSLGVILFEMLTGERPFRGDAASLLLQILTQEAPSPRLLMPTIPIDLETICLKCLQKNPQRRYQTGEELTEDLRRYLSGEPIRARPVGMWERSAKWCRRNPAWTAVFSATVIAILSVISAGYIHQRRLSETNERLRIAVDDAEKERRLANEQSTIAEARRIEAESTARTLAERELAARKLLYVDDIRQAEEFWKVGQLREMEDRLQKHAVAKGKTDIRGFEWYYLKRQCRQTADRSIKAHVGPVYAVALSPDGQWIASGGEDRVLRVYSSAGDFSREIPSQKDTIESIVFSPVGNLLGVGRGDGVVEIYRVSDWTRDTTIPAHSDNVNGIAFDPRAARIVTGSEDGTVAIWDCSSGKLIRRTAAAGSPVESVALSPDGILLAETHSNGMLRVSNFSDGALVWEFNHQQAARSIRFSQSGQELVTGCHDGQVRVFPRDRGTPRLILKGFAEPVQSVTFAESDRMIAAADKNGLLRFWDTESGIMRSVVQSPGGRIYSLAASQRDRVLAAADRSGHLQLWDTDPGARDKIVEATRVISDLKYAPSGTALVVALEYDIMNLTPVKGRQFVPMESQKSRFWTRVPVQWQIPLKSKAVAVTSDSRFVAAGDGFNRIVLLDAETGALHRAVVIPGSPFFAHCMTFSMQGDQLLSGGSPGDFIVIDIGDAQSSPLRVNPAMSDVWQIGLTRDRSRVFLAGNSLVAAYSFSNQSVTPLESPPPLVRTLAISPDGQLAVTGGADGTLSFWNISPWKKLGTVKTDSDEIWSLAFSCDGRTVVAGTKNHSLEFWHVDTRQQLLSIPFHHGAVSTVNFSADGHSLAIGTTSLTAGDPQIGNIEILSAQPIDSPGY